MRPNGKNTELVMTAVFAALMRNEITCYATPRGNVYVVPGDRWLDMIKTKKAPVIDNAKRVKTVAELFATTIKEA